MKLIEIGLANNLPDSAREATERQFRKLLDHATMEASSAGTEISVNLSCYSLARVPRSHMDGLIVTSPETPAARVTSESDWAHLAQLVNWAESNTRSTIWSGGAAHAAVYELDGIERRRLRRKLFGVYDTARAASHSLMAGVPFGLAMPHSRWNDIPEEDLLSCDYLPLMRSVEAGVDLFVKQGDSLFVFFQGHPEYETDSLLSEYRCDILRFLQKEESEYPAAPQGYFDERYRDLLHSLQVKAALYRREEILAGLPVASLAASIKNTWRKTAVVFYRNWLLRLARTARQGNAIRAHGRAAASA